MADNDTGGMNAMVAIIAIIAILAIGYFVLRMLPGNTVPNDGTNINVDLPGTTDDGQ
jgi:hypothetical protein